MRFHGSLLLVLGLISVLCPLPVSSNTHDTADSLSQRVTELRREGTYGEALEAARELVRAQRNRPDAQPWEIADAKHLVVTLESVVALSTPAQAELAEGDRLVAELEDLYAAGDYRAAARPARRIVELRRRHLGKEHVEIAKALSDLATVLYDLGAFAEAESVALSALGMRRQLLSPMHPDIAVSLNLLANVYIEQSRFSEAETMHREALRIREQAYGPAHVKVARSLHNLAVLHGGRGEYAAAESLLCRALEIREQALGPKHPQVADCLSNLGALLGKLGKYEQAEPVLQRAVEISREAYGPDHPKVFDGLSCLATLYKNQGRFTEAEQYYRDAQVILRNAHGGEHPKLAQNLSSLGILYLDLGRHAESFVHLRESLALTEKTYGPQSVQASLVLNNLALVHWDLGNYGEAVLLLRQALGTRVAVLGLEHSRVATAMNNLGALLDIQGRPAEAESLLLAALEIRTATLGPQHPRVASTLDNLGALCRDQGRLAEAEDHLLQGIAVLDATPDRNHPRRAAFLTCLAGVYQEQRHFAAAESLLHEALATRERSLGPDHPDMARVLVDIASLEEDRQQYDKALAALQRAEPIAVNALGPGHPLVCRILTEQGRCLLASGDPAGAEAVLTAAAISFESARPRLGTALARAASFRSPYDLLAAVRLEAGHAEAAWPAAERALGRAMADLLMASGHHTLSADEKLTADSLRQALGKLEDHLTALTSEAHRDPREATARELNRTRQQLLAADAAWSRFQQTMSERHGIAAGEPFDLPHIQRVLGPNVALVGWLAAPSVLEGLAGWGYVVRATGAVRWEPLTRKCAQSDSLLQRFGNALRLAATWRTRVPPSEALDDLAHGVWSTWWAPLEPHLKDVTDLVVIPSGPLLGIPLETLIDARGSSMSERFVISYAPSSSVYAWLREQPQERRARRSGLLVGDPPFTPEQLTDMQSAPLADGPLLASAEPAGSLDLRSALGGCESALARLPRLPWSRYEVEAIGQSLDRASILLGPAASEQELVRMAQAGVLQSYDIIHLATHALIDDQRPERSALILSLTELPDPMVSVIAGERIYDGMLTMGEVVREWQLRADLVTLSGCQTGLGQRVTGEGFVGMSHAFFQAGARSLLVSLWKVEDEAACLLMKRFYGNLTGWPPDRGTVEGAPPMSKAAALREAKHWLRAYTTPDGQHPFGHPAYWSGFVLIGDPG